MTNAPSYNGNTNPNARGGAFGYDGRTGLGIGSLTKGPASGIGSNWNMGDALSSPKSEFDYQEENNVNFTVDKNTTVKELAAFAGLIEIDEEFNELEADIESKSHSSFHRGATDSLAKKGTDISSLGGLGNSMAGVIGLSAGYKPTGKTMLECYIEELLLFESSASGRINVMASQKAANTGGKRNNDPLSIDNTSSSTNTSDPPPEGFDYYDLVPRNPITGRLPAGRHDNKGYTQNGKASTDGAETIGKKRVVKNYKKMKDSFDNNISTAEELMMSQEEIDERNVEYFKN